LPSHELQIGVTIGTVLASFGVGYLLSVLNDRRVKNNVIKSSMKALISEIKETVKALNKIDFPSMKFPEPKKINSFSQTFIRLDIPILESIINSGDFRELDVEIQKELGKLVGAVYMSNELNMKIIDVLYLSNANDSSIPSIESFVGVSDGKLKDAKSLMESILPMLKKYE